MLVLKNVYATANYYTSTDLKTYILMHNKRSRPHCINILVSTSIGLVKAAFCFCYNLQGEIQVVG